MAPALPQPIQSQPLAPPPAPSAAQSSATAASAAGFPPAPACTAGLCSAPVERKCRTTGNVTTCDAPADPGADSTLYTN